MRQLNFGSAEQQSDYGTLVNAAHFRLSLNHMCFTPFPTNSTNKMDIKRLIEMAAIGLPAHFILALRSHSGVRAPYSWGKTPISN